MEYIGVLIVAALVFGVCFLIDKGFTKLFRSQAQHMSGIAVRLNKKYGAIGLILFVLGVAGIFAGLGDSWLLIAGGSLIAVVGIGLVVYYMTFGVFYDSDSFILTTFGRRSTTYRYRDIKGQQLYNSYGNIVIELHMNDGRTVQLQSAMSGVYPFLDKAFEGWCYQKGIQREGCAFHDPDNSCWFPPVEEN
ncbi:MAG: hypothetical protein J6L24_03790 [Oscillospiraceae bacterium]|nr:hypothetical protein [Oscillospiraceae bacterium]